MGLTIPLHFSESDFIKACIHKEDWARRKLYEDSYHLLLGVSSRYASDQEQAVDILHDSYLKIFQNIHRYECGTSLTSWMRRIVVNTAIDYYRKEKIRQTEEITDARLFDKAVGNTSLSQCSMDEIVEAIQQLSPAYRTVFNLFVVEGYSHKEIGEQLGITESTSRSNLAKARLNLQKIVSLKELYHE